jgi:hypothetical protein
MTLDEVLRSPLVVIPIWILFTGFYVLAAAVAYIQYRRKHKRRRSTHRG